MCHPSHLRFKSSRHARRVLEFTELVLPHRGCGLNGLEQVPRPFRSSSKLSHVVEQLQRLAGVASTMN